MWLLLVIIAHVFNAVVFLVDKVFLAHVVKNPTVYAFFGGILSALVVVLFPWSPTVPPPLLLLVDLLAGGLFIGALIGFFNALKALEASRLVPFVGGVIPVLTFIASFHFLGERLTASQAIAFLLLVAGGILITLDPNHPQTRTTVRGWAAGSIAAVLFTASLVLMKYLYGQQPFLEAFIWSRFGSVLVSLVLLRSSALRRDIASTYKRLSRRLLTGFLANQALGASGFLLLNVAISWSSVTLVNALQGVQYLFIVIFVLIAALKRPGLLKEKITPMVVVEKLMAIVLIAEGLVLLT